MAPRQAVEAKERSPSFYYVDESDPDILVLCRQDGSFVAAFSARGATREGIAEATEEDYRELLPAQRDGGSEAAEEYRSVHLSRAPIHPSA